MEHLTVLFLLRISTACLIKDCMIYALINGAYFKNYNIFV